MYKYLLSLLFSFLFSACVQTSSAPRNGMQELAALLQTLDSSIPSNEAHALSQEIFLETRKLAQKFKPVSEPHINNFLINAGLKEQGLCYEWSDALYLYFKQSIYPDFEFHLLVANQGEYFFEHNVMVVTAKGGDVRDGVIIDPWRKPGEIYFAKVKEDTAYRWKHRAKRGCQNGR